MGSENVIVFIGFVVYLLAPLFMWMRANRFKTLYETERFIGKSKDSQIAMQRGTNAETWARMLKAEDARDEAEEKLNAIRKTLGGGA